MVVVLGLLPVEKLPGVELHLAPGAGPLQIMTAADPGLELLPVQEKGVQRVVVKDGPDHLLPENPVLEPRLVLDENILTRGIKFARGPLHVDLRDP